LIGFSTSTSGSTGDGICCTGFDELEVIRCVRFDVITGGVVFLASSKRVFVLLALLKVVSGRCGLLVSSCLSANVELGGTFSLSLFDGIAFIALTGLTTRSFADISAN
jgi:hypothetical protein